MITESFLFPERSDYEPQVLLDGAHQTVVRSHNLEALYKRGTMVLHTHASIEIVAQHLMSIVSSHATSAALLHDAYAPIDICRKAILEIIRCLLSNGGVGIERLMADKHSVLERLPRQTLRSFVVAMVKERAVIINDVRLAINDAEQCVVISLAALISCCTCLCRCHDVGYGIFVVKAITGVEETQIATCGMHDALVHGIIKSFVGFATDDDLMAGMQRIVHGAILFSHDDRVVLALAVDDEMLDVSVSLMQNAVKSALQDISSVVCAGYKRNLHN